MELFVKIKEQSWGHKAYPHDIFAILTMTATGAHQGGRAN
jgi:hypothetical protein